MVAEHTDQVQTTTMAGEYTTPPLGFLGILKESLRIPARNGKFMAPITLFVAFPLCALAVVSDLFFLPLELDYSSKMDSLPKYDPNSPEAKEIVEQMVQDLIKLKLFQALFIIVTSLVRFFSLIAIVHVSAMAYTGEHLTLRELISRRRWWKQPLITALLVLILSLGYDDAVAYLDDAIPLIVLSWLVDISASILYIYLCTTWMVGLVISVVADDCCGMKALVRSGEIIKGRKLQGFLLALLLYVVYRAIHLVYVLTFGMKEVVVQGLVAAVITVGLQCLVFIFMCVVGTVFYFECTKIIDGETTVNSMYRPIYDQVSLP